MTTTWDLTPLLQSDDDPKIEIMRKEIERANSRFVNKWKKRKDYLSNASILKDALDDYELLTRRFYTGGNEEYYFWLRMMQDQNDSGLKAKFTKAQDVSLKLRNELQFFELNLAKIPKTIQKQFLKNNLLLDYRHFLEKIFNRSDYLLTENEEKIINLKSDPAYQKWEQMISGFISKEERNVETNNGKVETKNLEQLLSLISDKNKKVRDSAAAALNDILAKHADSAEAEINAILANKKIDDGLRNIQRPDFSRHLDDDIETEVVDTLIEAVSKRYDISRRFYAFKAKLLGLKKLQYHERNVEYGLVDKSYSFSEGVKLVNKVFGKVDLEFAEIFSGFLANGQVDVYPNKGKRGGAFCSYWLISQPTYLLLNYSGKLRDVTTLAHESGHGINDELMKKKQNALNFGTPVATAEVASTFMEDFVLQEILKSADDEIRLGILMTKLNDEISTIFRQAACYQFEQDLHSEFRDKGYLSHQEIGAIFQKHMKEYMGNSVEQSAGSQNWWIYWSHIRTFFYVYSYVSGLLISKSLQNSVKQNPVFISQVKEFLSAGLSESPKTIFKKIGIDITDVNFWNKGLDEVEALLNEAEKLAGKLRSMSKDQKGK